MLYRMLRAVNVAYPIVMLWVYLGVFALALPFMFVFPPLSLVLVIAGALSVPFVFVIRMALTAPQRALARASLRRGACPRCGEFVVDAAGDPDGRWHCVSCGTLFGADGAEIDMPSSGAPAAIDHEARLAL